MSKRNAAQKRILHRAHEAIAGTATSERERVLARAVIDLAENNASLKSSVDRLNAEKSQRTYEAVPGCAICNERSAVGVAMNDRMDDLIWEPLCQSCASETLEDEEDDLIPYVELAEYMEVSSVNMRLAHDVVDAARELLLAPTSDEKLAALDTAVHDIVAFRDGECIHAHEHEHEHDEPPPKVFS